MNYQKLILVGNVTSDAQRRTSKAGDVAYTTFGVGIGDIKGRTTFFPVSVFGEHGEALVKHLAKGRQVLVEGRIEVAQSGRFNVVADRVVLGAPAGKPAEKTE